MIGPLARSPVALAGPAKTNVAATVMLIAIGLEVDGNAFLFQDNMLHHGSAG
jgi:hypothetical protein